MLNLRELLLLDFLNQLRSCVRLLKIVNHSYSLAQLRPLELKLVLYFLIILLLSLFSLLHFYVLLARRQVF